MLRKDLFLQWGKLQDGGLGSAPLCLGQSPALSGASPQSSTSGVEAVAGLTLLGQPRVHTRSCCLSLQCEGQQAGVTFSDKKQR